VMAVVACASFFLELPYPVFGVYLLIFTSVPVGMAMGTQDKEYYFL
jgi:hypothetical protein